MYCFRDHWLCFSQKLTNDNCSVANYGISCPTTLIMVRIGMICVYTGFIHPYHCEFICSSALLCPEDTLSLLLYTISESFTLVNILSCNDFWALGRGYTCIFHLHINNLHLSWSFFSFFFFQCFYQLWLSVTIYYK